MAEYIIQETTLTDIADAIRDKTGTSGDINPLDMPEKIAGIETGVDTSDATATANDIVSGKTAYVNGEKVTGSILQMDEVSVYSNNVSIDTFDQNFVKVSGVSYTDGKIIKDVTTIGAKALLSDFGNATSSDVASGKTFTSSAGVQVTGTANIRTYLNVTIVNSVGFASVVIYAPLDGEITLTGSSRVIQVPINGCFAVRVNYDMNYENNSLAAVKRLWDGEDTTQGYDMYIFKAIDDGGYIRFYY